MSNNTHIADVPGLTRRLVSSTTLVQMSGLTKNVASSGINSATVMMNGQIPIFNSFSKCSLTLEEPEDMEMLNDDDGEY